MNRNALFNNPFVFVAMGMAVAASIFGATLVHADTAPTVTTVILDAGNLATTSVQVGSFVKATAAVASSTGSTTPSGTVNFSLFQNTSCANASTTQSNVSLVNGHATSSSSVVSASGLSYLVYYNGDINYPAANGVCQSVATTTSPTPPVSGPDTISGVVYNDLNGNDVKDASDPGLSGWTVWLHQGTQKYNSPIVMTATTDANGNYSFGGLAVGTYFIEQQEQTGWNQTSSDSEVFLGTVSASGTVNFANMVESAGTIDCQQGHDNRGNNNGKGSWYRNFMATSTDRGNKGNDNGNKCMATSTDQGHGGNGTMGNGGDNNHDKGVATSTDQEHQGNDNNNDGNNSGGKTDTGNHGGNTYSNSGHNSNNSTNDNAGSGHSNAGAGGGRGRGNH